MSSSRSYKRSSSSIGEKVSKHLPFLAAEYQGRKVTIRRNPDYQETISSVKRAFSALNNTATNQILLCARFEEFGDDLQVTDELWSDLLPRLMLVTVMLDEFAPPPPPPPETIASIKKHVHGLDTTPSGQIVISAFLEEVDDHVQITEEVWEVLLPRFLTVRLELKNEPHDSPASSNTYSNGNREPLATPALAAPVAPARVVSFGGMNPLLSSCRPEKQSSSPSPTAAITSYNGWHVRKVSKAAAKASSGFPSSSPVRPLNQRSMLASDDEDSEWSLKSA
ncbi:unnamed protein product [Rhizoctonia solani]|uniref:Uncharacterized protein n=1 Tax=Rhizoctonia solani TaxID=456999 RepID=A0A8H3AFQ1_9AGAM|nr:unnamed protein product [Rhizoctonia solani]